jgi:4-carboxymuconolactone decarboxylase
MALAPGRPTLIGTAGEGLVGQWKGLPRLIRHGDVVRIPAGVKHWHGAAPGSPMTHVPLIEAVDGKVVKWLEKVTDEQYQARH